MRRSDSALSDFLPLVEKQASVAGSCSNAIILFTVLREDRPPARGAALRSGHPY